MRTQTLHLKVLFLSFLFLFLPFLCVNSDANQQNEDYIGFGECMLCHYLTPLLEEQEWFYCGNPECGVLNFGTIIVGPPGTVFCEVCKLFYPIGSHEH